MHPRTLLSLLAAKSWGGRARRVRRDPERCEYVNGKHGWTWVAESVLLGFCWMLPVGCVVMWMGSSFRQRLVFAHLFRKRYLEVLLVLLVWVLTAGYSWVEGQFKVEVLTAPSRGTCSSEERGNEPSSLLTPCSNGWELKVRVFKEELLKRPMFCIHFILY